MPTENFKMSPVQRDRSQRANGFFSRWFTNPKSRPLAASDNYGKYNPKLPNTGPAQETPVQSFGTFRTAPRSMPMRMIRDQNGNHTF